MSNQAQPLEWLNENQYRAYPIKFSQNRTVTLKGIGRLSVVAGESSPGEYLVHGLTTKFTKQIEAGDTVSFFGFTAGVIRVEGDSTMYVDTDLTASSHTEGLFSVIKKNGALDDLILDANLAYSTTPAQIPPALTRIRVHHDDLIFYVSEQDDFVVTDYDVAEYPYYSYNTTGNLMVIGEAALRIDPAIAYDATITNQYFEDAVCSYFDGPWKGVSSLQFNSGTPLTGDLVFTEGYQVGLTPDAKAATLAIAAGYSYGLPLGCVRLFPALAPADCEDAIAFINGVGPKDNLGNVDLVGGQHVVIYPDPDNHRIYVGLNFAKEDICTSIPPQPSTPL